MEYPVVDFPHPDSPTSPIVSPFCILKETPSTAFTYSIFILEIHFQVFYFQKCIIWHVGFLLSDFHTLHSEVPADGT